jgi:hypothetical protein
MLIDVTVVSPALARRAGGEAIPAACAGTIIGATTLKLRAVSMLLLHTRESRPPSATLTSKPSPGAGLLSAEAGWDLE